MKKDKRPPILFRVDADAKIGSGHFMRCLALGQHWKSRGGEVVFIGHLGFAALAERIERECFGWLPIREPHPSPADIALTLDKLSRMPLWPDGGRPWLVLDGYQFDGAYQKAIRESGRLAILDDHHHFSRYHSDILVNQNILAERIEYRCDADTVVLAGSRYAILRSEFINRAPAAKPAPAKAGRLLVTMGGANQLDALLTVLGAIERAETSELDVKLVVGLNDSIGSRLSEAVSKVNTSRQAAGIRVELILNADMPELMAWADMALTAGGSTCWELAYMGVPAMVVVLADNQEGIARGLAETGIAVNLGPVEGLTKESLAGAIEGIVLDQTGRSRRSLQARKLVDGLGGARILDALENRERSVNAPALHG